MCSCDQFSVKFLFLSEAASDKSSIFSELGVSTLLVCSELDIVEFLANGPLLKHFSSGLKTVDLEKRNVTKFPGEL